MRQGPATRQPILLKGGTIVSMDPKVGDFAKGTAHRRQEDRRLCRPGQSSAPSEVIDASNTILLQVGRRIAFWKVSCAHHPGRRHRRYMATTHKDSRTIGRTISSRQSDHLAGCIDAGITCVIDTRTTRARPRTPTRVQALIDSGIRGSTPRARRRPRVGSAVAADLDAYRSGSSRQPTNW